MRKFWSLIALLASLFAAQSTLAAAAGYGACCVEGCTHVAVCASASCVACAAVAAAPAAVNPALHAPPAPHPRPADDRVAPVSGAEVWTPPD